MKKNILCTRQNGSMQTENILKTKLYDTLPDSTFKSGWMGGGS